MKKTAKEREAALSQSTLHRLVLYHPITGEFTKTDGTAMRTSIDGRGCVKISIPNKGQFRAHRLAFLFMEGSWPEHYVDHIDGNPYNNAWSNLRRATQSQNQQNRRSPYKNNTTGKLGVCKIGPKFEARISIERTVVRIGMYDTVEEAHAAYVKVKRELHPFGEL